jgi:hypothetical protein
MCSAHPTSKKIRYGRHTTEWETETEFARWIEPSTTGRQCCKLCKGTYACLPRADATSQESRIFFLPILHSPIQMCKLNVVFHIRSVSCCVCRSTRYYYTSVASTTHFFHHYYTLHRVPLDTYGNSLLKVKHLCHNF